MQQSGVVVQRMGKAELQIRDFQRKLSKMKQSEILGSSKTPKYYLYICS